MTNCVPQVFKWFVTHLSRGILASLIDETQGLFFLFQKEFPKIHFWKLFEKEKTSLKKKKIKKKEPKVLNGDLLQIRQYKHLLM
jgi:hypothetical protein